MVMIVQFLKKIEFSKIIQANNGNAALQKLYLNQVDLIVSDWWMPDMDGLEFYKTAKKEGNLDNIPFLMVSAENEKSRIAEVLKAGVNDYILKPVNLELFKAKIEKLLNPKN